MAREFVRDNSPELIEKWLVSPGEMSHLHIVVGRCSMLQYVAVCVETWLVRPGELSHLHIIVVRCSMLQCILVCRRCCSGEASCLHIVVVRCSILQCVEGVVVASCSAYTSL